MQEPEEPHKPDSSEHVDRYASRYRAVRAHFTDMALASPHLSFGGAQRKLEALLNYENQQLEGSGLQNYTLVDALDYANHKIKNAEPAIPLYWDRSMAPMAKDNGNFTRQNIASIMLKTPDIMRFAERMVHLRNFYDQAFNLVYARSLRGDVEDADIVRFNAMSSELIDGMVQRFPAIGREEWCVEFGLVQSVAVESIRADRAHARNTVGPTIV